jgi:hypothetical protein
MLFGAILAAALRGPSDVAFSRCNDNVATQLEDRVRGFEGRPPSADASDARFVALQLIISNADEESVILRAVCAEDDYRPLAAHLLAVQAWALLLESDLNRANYAMRCPPAELPVAKALIANAWVLIARADPSGTAPYPTVKTVRAKVLSRASAAGLTLPAPDLATAYWLSGLQQAGSDAIGACPK